MFYFDTIENKKVLKSTLFEGVEHFFTTREFPLAPGSLNEIETSCINNREIAANYLEINTECLISPIQTHSANITIAQRTKKDYDEIDALVLSSKNLAIFLNFADCVPLMFWDEVNNVGAIAHAGWRGTAQAIGVKTLEFMKKYYETDSQNVKVLIGPAIGIENYQVGIEVFEKIICAHKDRYKDSWKFDKNNQKYNVDLKKINYHQLKDAGVQKIDLCGYCTYDTNDIFFSYRKENGICARHSAVMKLKE